MTELTFDALERGLWAREVRGGLIHYSDRYWRHLGIRYTERLRNEGVDPSVGSSGDSYDNVLTESIIGLF